MSCEAVAKVLYINDDTMRGWAKRYGEGDASRLSFTQEDALVGWAATTLPRSMREIGAFIEREFGVVYERRAGLISLLHRLGSNTRSPR